MGSQRPCSHPRQRLHGGIDAGIEKALATSECKSRWPSAAVLYRCRTGVPCGSPGCSRQGAVRASRIRSARQAQASSSHARRAGINLRLLREASRGERVATSRGALAPPWRRSRIRNPLAQSLPFLPVVENMRRQKGRPTAQGRRRGSGTSLAYKIRLRTNRRVQQGRRHVRPK